MAQPLRILHIISGLSMGGAEMVLYRLLSRLENDLFTNQVISLTDDQPLGELIRNLGIPVTQLGFRRSTPDPRLVTCLMAHLRETQPDLVQTWMYHADLTGGLAARLTGSTPVVWGLHHTVTGYKSLRPTTYFIARINALISHFLPAKVICCAETTRSTHIKLGYSAKKMTVIPNGFDLETFQPSPQARHAVREELGVEKETLLIGMGARFDPQKDHKTFLHAAHLLQQDNPQVHFVLWGKGVDCANSTLVNWTRSYGLGNSIHLLGLRQDAPRLTAAMDMISLSSAYGEAFPLVIGEAMASSVPCVVTDIGDSAALVGETGRVVPARNPVALAKAWQELLNMSPSGRSNLGKKARQRIERHYSLINMAQRYGQIYRDIIEHGHRR